MAAEELKVGEASKPRFEYRSFGQEFEIAAWRMARLSMPVPERLWERHSAEVYIVSRTNDVNNTKIRDGKMDIKTLVRSVDDLEQWSPLMKAEFPIPAELLREQVYPAFQVTIPNLEQASYTLGEFLTLVDAHPELQSVDVRKQRFGYLVNDTICETANVLINGAKVVTINSESTEIENIKKCLVDLGLEDVENINYLRAIKRIIGMIRKPLANWGWGPAPGQFAQHTG
jgi:ribosomal protein L30/L7E